MELNSRGMYEPSPSKATSDLPRGSKSVFDTPKHTLVEPKLDGVRVLLHFLPDGRVEATSRRRDQSGFYSRLTDNFPHLTGLCRRFSGYTILDGEVMMPKLVGKSTGTLGSIMSVVGSLPDRAVALQQQHGFVRFYCFDALMVNGVDVRNEKLKDRQAMAFMSLELLENQYMTPVNRWEVVEGASTSPEDQKRELMAKALEAGFEGLVLKDPDSGYYDKRAWLKVKAEETVDVIVHGFKPGQGKYSNTLGALKGSVIDAATGELVSVCAAMPGDDAARDELYGRIKDLSREETLELRIIAEIEFQGWTVDNRMRHPRTRRYRPDRSEPNTVDFSKVKKI